MGKEEVKEEEPDEEGTISNEPEIITENETEEDDVAQPPKKPNSKIVENKDESSDIKKNPDDLRKVIKLGSSEEPKEAEPQKQKEKKVDLDETDSEPTTRESLEQKRAILQSIKDFDFQIKKNQEELTSLNRKLDTVVKDLDDLVSLYEIVSEQMNPFVGLSKVTKKRIDALENFTKEIELVKERTAELESFAERSGAKLKKPSIKEESEKEDLNVTSETDDTELPEEEIENDISIEISTDENQQLMSINLVDNNGFSEFSDSDWDIILARALGDMFPESKIDMIIDEFIESLKD